MDLDLDDLSLERLMKERLWSFGKADTDEVFAAQIAFESGGWLRGYGHANEHSWRAKGGAVEFLNESGVVTTRFGKPKAIDGRVEMEGQFRLPGERPVLALKETGEARKPEKRTALIIPIHDAYFIYGINLLFQSMGSDYDIVFVFSTDADRLKFRAMHQASPFLGYSSIVLSDHFSGSAMSVIADKNIWPTVKKFLAISLTYRSYDHLLCVDAETFVLNPIGWNAASADIIKAERWYAGMLGADNAPERQIMHASSTILAPSADLETIRDISRNWSFYSWWWDLPVYSAASVPGFLEWVGWETSLQFVERLAQNVFDHITYQFYMVLHGGFSFVPVDGVKHAMEFCSANMVANVHQQIHPIRWVNAFAYAQNPGFFRQHDYLAVYHIDRKTFPQFNPV